MPRYFSATGRWALPPESVAAAIAFDQPHGVEIDDITIRPSSRAIEAAARPGVLCPRDAGSYCPV